MSRGLALALGVGGTLYEVTYDQLRHPIVIPYFLGFFGFQVLTEPIWKHFLMWTFRMERISLKIGPWIELDMVQPHPPSAPPEKTLRVPADILPPEVLPKSLPAETRSLPSPSTSPSPSPSDGDTPRFPFE